MNSAFAPRHGETVRKNLVEISIGNSRGTKRRGRVTWRETCAITAVWLEKKNKNYEITAEGEKILVLQERFDTREVASGFLGLVIGFHQRSQLRMIQRSFDKITIGPESGSRLPIFRLIVA